MPDELPLTFIPTPAQWRYLRAYLDPNNSGAIKHCAQRANVNWRTVYDWLADERFRQWFTEETRRVFTHRLPAMWSKCLDLAAEGSPEHIRLIAMRTGELIQPGSHDQRQLPATAVFINVPRPPQLAERAPGALLEVGELAERGAVDAQLVTEQAHNAHNNSK